MCLIQAEHSFNFCEELPVICVQGLGFVGAAMATAIASAKNKEGRRLYNVIGLDLSTEKGKTRVEAINRGVFPFSTADSNLQRQLRECVGAGNFIATLDQTSLTLASVVVVDIHLDVFFDQGVPKADFQGFEKAFRTIGRLISPETLVVVETTVPPGTCEHLIKTLLQNEFKKRGLHTEEVLIAHSYERVMPGPSYFDSIVNFWRVYAGVSEKSAEMCRDFLSTIINVRKYPLRQLSSTTASETAKILENTYRAVNIALIDEWSQFAEASNIDLHEVIEAIRDRPTHNNIRQPGFGVGGYCLTKDPYFGEVAKNNFFKGAVVDFQFANLAIETNSRMPIRNLDRVQRLLGGNISGKKLIVLGVAYRSDVDDTRFSPAETFCKEAQARGAEIVVHDPYVKHWEEMDIVPESDLPDLVGVDAVIFCVPHEFYRTSDVVLWIEGFYPLIYDCDSVLARKDIATLGDMGVTIYRAGSGANLK